MIAASLNEAVSRQFHSSSVQSFFTCLGLRQPISFSHVVSASAMPQPTLTPALSDTFTFHIQHRTVERVDIWLDGKHASSPTVRDGDFTIFDLQSKPTAQILQPFEFSRFHVPRAALDDLSYEQGLPRIRRFRTDSVDPDPVVKHLALALRGRMARHGGAQDALFTDAVMLALLTHISQTYGGAAVAPLRIGSLLPWQIQRIVDWLDAHLHGPISIADLAGLLDLSPSHFSRSFARSFGMPPHQWVSRQRVARAKQLMKVSSMSLSEVAAACGFADQSHLSNVFLKIAGHTPGRWRRNHPQNLPGIPAE